ncbi:uncharacterized protein N7500_008438, partial [Penicillium coprophilum]|uniref:uncharacterized protein n=1 Tax=Penicillium coprophilum TaxID=36646 RepID=UPI00239D92B0
LLALIEEKVEAISTLPELLPSPIPESITKLKDRVNRLEDRYSAPSYLIIEIITNYTRITEKQKRIADLEAYLENL